MQQVQHHEPIGWEAACLSLMDSELPALNVSETQSTPSTIEAGQQPAARVQQLEEVAPQKSVEPAPTDLNSIFASYRNLQAEIDRLVGKHRQLEHSLFGQSFTSEPKLEDIEELAKSTIQALISQAEKIYAPSGGRLSISHNEVMEALGLEDWAYSRRSRRSRRDEDCTEVEQFVDLVRLQAHLEKTYGGDAGVRRGLQQAAAVIIDQFDLKRQESVARVKTGVILSTRVYSTKKDYGVNKGMYEPYHSGRDRVPLFLALETFFKYAGLDQLYNYGWTRSDLVQYGFCFTPREKRTCPGMEISFFKEEWKFKFAPSESEKLMLFLGEFGQEE